MIVNLTSSQCSFSSDAILATTYANDGIVRGLGFVYEKNFAIANGATLYVLHDYTGYVPAQGQLGQIYVMPPQFSCSKGPVLVSVYRGTNYTGGTPFTSLNANTTSPKTQSGTIHTSGATGTVKGTLVLEYLVGTDAQGGSADGGQAIGLEFFIRPNTGKTLVEIVNNSGSNITFHYAQVMYEI